MIHKQPDSRVSYIERECEVRVKAREQDEERRDEVVDGSCAWVGRHRDRDQVDHRNDGAT